MKNLFENKLVIFLTKFIFWSWNGLFLILIVSLVIPLIGFGVFKGLINGEIPLDFFIILTLGVAVPIISTIIAAKKFIKNPQKLFVLFYGIEAPLVGVLFLRLLVFRELTPGTMHLLVLFIIGTILFLYDLFYEYKSIKHRIISYIAYSILLIFGIYSTLIILMYFFPLAGTFIIEFLKFEWISALKYIFQSFYFIIFILFFLFSATVFLILPITLPILYIGKFIKSFKFNSEQYSKNMLIAIALLVFIVNIALFQILNIQAQEKVYKDFPYLNSEKITLEQKKSIIKNQKLIKKALVNQYLAPYRYISPEKGSNSISELYTHVFSLAKNDAQNFQNFHNFLLKPFLYKGETLNFDDYLAQEKYRYFFDNEIQKAEKKAVTKALQSRWDRDEVLAGLMNINDEKVHVDTQKISFTEENGIAEIELFETYTNKTNGMQEIFYYFSLPQNAVITGLWLSNEASVEKKYKFQVSPRGAAQQVYNNQVSENTDPSIIEQTGPGMYRLKAFPVLPLNNFDKNAEKPVFKIYLKYLCIEKDGKYNLPKMSEKRNVFFDKKTDLYINNEKAEKKNSWWPQNIVAKTKFEPEKMSDSACKIMKFSPQINIEKAKIALIIDPTYSMNFATNDLVKLFSDYPNINGNVFFAENDTFAIRNIEDFNIKDYFFFGNTSSYNILKNFKTLNLEKNYDAIIFITDAGSYEAENDNLSIIHFQKPLYFLHLNNNLPKSYNDATLETIIKSGGTTAGNFKNIIENISFQMQKSEKNQIYDPENSLIWQFNEVNNVINSIKNENLQKIAAKQIINLTVQNSDSVNLNTLDFLHRIALENNIVSQFSSMIVLINIKQLKALQNAENKNDRFDREVESGVENLTKPNNPFTVTGTPEPEEWILILFSIAIIIFTMVKIKR